MTDSFFTAADVVFAYTRQEAINDGVLHDVSVLAKGFNFPVAITCGLWNEISQDIEGDDILPFISSDLKQIIEDGKEASRIIRLNDFLNHALVEVKKYLSEGGNGDRVDFDYKGTACYIHIGPGDDPKPVLTIMLKDED